jgi:drug/metabolite transporter (DMT)-like permease
MTGWGLHIGALARAPISIVQAFVAGGIALTVPMAALGRHHRVGREERRGTALIVAGLVLLAVGLHDPGTAVAFSPAALGGYLAALALLAAVSAAGVRGARRAAALGAAGGLLYGAADLAIKALTIVHREHGLAGALTSPWAAIAIAASCGAFFAFQRGLQTGRPVSVIALMTAATNLASIAGGFVVFGDPLGSTPLLAALHLTAFGLIGIAALWLAPSQAAVVAD